MIKKKFSDALQFVKERYVAKKIRKIVGSGEQGFTLLEILVVLTIMGFLIAMVAPRLAGISGDAVDTVCDSNQNRMVTYMGSYYEKTSRFPNNLTNIVEEISADTTYQIPAVSDDDPDNGAETLAREFNDRNHFRIHYLNNEEAAELKKMGIVSLYNLNDYSAYVEDGSAIKTGYDSAAGVNNDVALAGSVIKASKMKKKTISTDVATNPLAVAMIGLGFDSAGALVAETEERGWGEPDFFGRIVLGMGPESALVKDGVISNAAHCPGGIQNADNATYNDYNLILPRLEATVDRLTTTALATAGIADHDASSTDTTEITAVCYDKAPAAASYDTGTNTENLRVRTITVNEAQSGHQYSTQCPEGHMYPEDDGEFWGVTLDAGNTVD